MTQPSLFATRDADAAARYAGWMRACLCDGHWWTARALSLRVEGGRVSDRVWRQIAAESQGTIISGQRGYRLTKCASVEEIDHAERWLLSQARHMTDRAREIRVARNRSGEAA